jgi:hypothetical protein
MKLYAKMTHSYLTDNWERGILFDLNHINHYPLAHTS